MKNILLVVVSVLAVFFAMACDSLWTVSNVGDVTFTIRAEDLEKVFQKNNIGSRSVFSDDEILTITISLHFDSNDRLISTKTLPVEDDDEIRIRFEALQVVGKTIYAKASLRQDGILLSARSKAKKMGTDENVLSLVASIMPLIEVPSGSFTFGSVDIDSYNLTKVDDFLLSRTEVTQGQYLDVIDVLTGGSVFNGNNVAMNYVGWYDAIKFCNELSIIEGLEPVYYLGDTYPDVPNISKYTFLHSKVVVNENLSKNGYRLPTEKEWEYAAGHGGYNNDGSAKERFLYAGTNSEGELDNYAQRSGINPQEVGKLKPNPLGLYDMSGNAAEWYGFITDDTNGVRGGAVSHYDQSFEVTHDDPRFGSNTSDAAQDFYTYGFRVARNAE